MPLVTVTRNYVKCRKKLSKERQALADDAIEKFEADPFNAELHFETITKRAGYHSIRVDFGTRTLLHGEAMDASEFEARAVGNHDYVYKAYFK